jgi:uncharacterized membrane protein YphA (DoxX/SURF4 family)
MRSLIFKNYLPKNLIVNLTWLLLRLHLGLSFAIGAGYPKIQQFPSADWFLEQVTELGFPFPALFAFLAAWGEFLGGIFVAVGLFTRLFALQLTIQMAVAAFMFHKSNFLVDLSAAHSYFWIFLTITVIGSGKIAIDHFFRKS